MLRSNQKKFEKPGIFDIIQYFTENELPICRVLSGSKKLSDVATYCIDAQRDYTSEDDKSTTTVIMHLQRCTSTLSSRPIDGD